MSLLHLLDGVLATVSLLTAVEPLDPLGSLAPSEDGEVLRTIVQVRHATERVRVLAYGAWRGDPGGTELAGASRPSGLDLEGSVDATRWLSLDAHVAWVPPSAPAPAPRWLGSGGITLHDERLGFVAMRVRTAEGLVVDAMVGRTLGAVDVALTLTNSLDAGEPDAELAVTATAAMSF
jgi:hypothetical protein